MFLGSLIFLDCREGDFLVYYGSRWEFEYFFVEKIFLGCLFWRGLSEKVCVVYFFLLKIVLGFRFWFFYVFSWVY